jgi:hypothetical protein
MSKSSRKAEPDAVWDTHKQEEPVKKPARRPTAAKTRTGAAKKASTPG